MEIIDNHVNSKSNQLEQNQPIESNDNQALPNALDFSRLTHQNWLFINAFLSTGNIKKAYQLAKYTGTEKSAPYQIFKKLKTYIEQIGDLDVTSRARLQADIKSVLDIPLEERQTLKFKEWLEIRKFTAKISPEATQPKQRISVLVINRLAEKGTRDVAESSISPLDPTKIIDTDPLP